MELQAVELVRRHLVDDLEERRLAEEVPALVDQEPAPAEARRIVDVDARDAPRAGVAGDELAKRLRSVEKPARVGRFDQ